MGQEINCYAFLDVCYDATDEEIREAYRISLRENTILIQIQDLGISRIILQGAKSI